MAQAPEKEKLNLFTIASILDSFKRSEGGISMRSMASGEDEVLELTRHAKWLGKLGIADIAERKDKGGLFLAIIDLWSTGKQLLDIMSNTEAKDIVVKAFGVEIDTGQLHDVINFGSKTLSDLLKSNPERKQAKGEKKSQHKGEKVDPDKISEPTKVEPLFMTLGQALREFNVERRTAVDFLAHNGFEIDDSPYEGITKEQFALLEREFTAMTDVTRSIRGVKQKLLSFIKEELRHKGQVYDFIKIPSTAESTQILLQNTNAPRVLDYLSKELDRKTINTRIDQNTDIPGIEPLELYQIEAPANTPLEKFIGKRNLEDFVESQQRLLSNNLEAAITNEHSRMFQFIRGFNQFRREQQIPVQEVDGGIEKSNMLNLDESDSTVAAQLINNSLQLATLNSDSAHRGQDLLGFMQDIEAFASIVALKELTPPLAIALFGQWGTGKSFFMQKLSEKVEELAETQGFEREVDGEEEESTDAPENKPFCEGVCQIHFNAWSYMDTNLWASLVTRIFEGLDEYINDNVTDADKEKAAIKSKITKQLDVAKGQLDELEAQKKQIANSIETLEKQVELAQEDLNTQITEIKGANRQVAIENALKGQGFKTKLKDILHTADMGQSDLQEVDPDLILKELKSVHTFAKQLLKFKGRDWVWIALTLVFFGLAIFAGDWLSDQWSNISKAIAGGLTFIVGGISKVKQTVNKLSPLVNDVIKVKDEYQQVIKQAVSTHEQSILAMKIEADQKEIALNELNLQLKNKEAEVKALDFSAEAVLAQKTMYNFITRKAQSSEYSKHLGIISMIRKDFQTLSHLFVESLEELKALRKKVDAGEISTKELEVIQKRILSLTKYEEFKKGFNKPLERIILYIDDLDRCPEERVVEVLEAVNLLMAFPLFVVVVGVDPRWVKNALIQKYQLQFTGHLKGEKLQKNLGMEMINPSDYLEKIFQVPFHLMSPSDKSIQAMIEHLIGDSVLKEEETKGSDPIDEGETAVDSEVDPMPEAKPEPEMNSRFDELFQEADKAFADDIVREPVEEYAAGNRAVEESNTVPESKPEGAVPKPVLKRVTPDSLKLHRAELEYMKDFSWLIGNTPRTVKRFVNMYRIIRAHEGLSYKDTREKEDLMCILFLLALQTGPYKEFDLKIKLLLDSNDIGGLTFGEVVKNELTILPDIAEAQDQMIDFKHSSLLKKLLYEEAIKPLRELNTNVIFKHSQFIKRFRFQSEDIQYFGGLYEEEFQELEEKAMNRD